MQYRDDASWESPAPPPNTYSQSLTVLVAEITVKSRFRSPHIWSKSNLNGLIIFYVLAWNSMKVHSARSGSKVANHCKLKSRVWKSLAWSTHHGTSTTNICNSPIFKYEEVVFIGECGEFVRHLGSKILQDVYMCLQYTDVRTYRVGQFWKNTVQQCKVILPECGSANKGLECDLVIRQLFSDCSNSSCKCSSRSRCGGWGGGVGERAMPLRPVKIVIKKWLPSARLIFQGCVLAPLRSFWIRYWSVTWMENTIPGVVVVMTSRPLRRPGW